MLFNKILQIKSIFWKTSDKNRGRGKINSIISPYYKLNVIKKYSAKIDISALQNQNENTLLELIILIY
ncbi:hypothetical protein CNEO3_140080 [Clostridium neonatale]|uniref:Uncharacterized protein n=1 Tax=Clostridium neonatale TaxID=137838 RepID=A0AA86JKR5_9CLOT|nr:hypothetical protein CNEO_40203 [Clostridium neonatale]CAI3535765.1 hypothetical protein CNEO4_100078 [Clostridium neonatale]CAI3542677.1 hypothetical protein CNEO3_160079 [Clostridium neonatale]CAI3550713.1 hypothetical protein CNEO4_1470077 [Clostridium neonatale]CAI3573967.1 hypothetical protein CNEO3_120079 [Clostridium neonatale]